MSAGREEEIETEMGHLGGDLAKGRGGLDRFLPSGMSVPTIDQRLGSLPLETPALPDGEGTMTHLTSVELTITTMTAAIAVRRPAIVPRLCLPLAKRLSFPSTRAQGATRLEHPISASTGTGVSGMISLMEAHRRLGGFRVAVGLLDPRIGWDSADSWIMRGE